jgi:hypothetical protein
MPEVFVDAAIALLWYAVVCGNAGVFKSISWSPYNNREARSKSRKSQASYTCSTSRYLDNSFLANATPAGLESKAYR